jgi:20S proteasome alpha/beta subunit
VDFNECNEWIHKYIFRYEHGNNKVMSTAAAAQLLSVTLYYRRFFPYYSFCLIAGLDEEGACISSLRLLIRVPY